MAFLIFCLTSRPAARYCSRVACSFWRRTSLQRNFIRLWFRGAGTSHWILVERACVAQFTIFLAYVLSAMGLTILVVWPKEGPGAFAREKALRRILPRFSHGVLDCYICFSFWMGLLLSFPWWCMYRQGWIWFGCLMVPAVFWLFIGR